MAFNINFKIGLSKSECDVMRCGILDHHSSLKEFNRFVVTAQWHCNEEIFSDILCEKQPRLKFVHKLETAILFNGTNHWPSDISLVKCPLGHYTHSSLACDVRTSCLASDHFSPCEWSFGQSPPIFTCTNQIERVPYVLVCDHRTDCTDDSDENFCSYPPCQTEEFECHSKRCIPLANMCDGWKNCEEEEDENTCLHLMRLVQSINPPALISVSDKGRLVMQPLLNTTASGEMCPHSHFQCLNNGYCLPVLLRCNGVHDCPGGEDEAGCDVCPGFYRCRASTVCLLPTDLCDGRPYCPQHDDELICDLTCPPFCVCFGMAFYCRHSFTATSALSHLRFLDASGSGMTPDRLNGSQLLVHLALSNCDLEHINGIALPNLIRLDIQNNNLRRIGHRDLFHLPQLREIFLADNPLVDVFDGVDGNFPNLLKLDLSRVALYNFNGTMLSLFPNLQVLNLSNCGVQYIKGEGFSALQRLRVIDLRGCPMTWLPRNIFQGLSVLKTVYAHNFKVCCPTVLPAHFNIHMCFAPWNEISSCDDLLRGKIYSVSVFILSLLAMLGNTVCFIFRTYLSKSKNKLGYGIFVSHLSVSDFLMGVYLAIIGVSNQVYSGNYVWNDWVWKHSVACKLAGFLSLLSSEVSALTMCLITMDRLLVLRYPLKRRHFNRRTAQLASILVWACGISLASVPLLPVTAHWDFYSQTGICIPLPITRKDFAGHKYSFGIVIILNFIIFVFISIGQLSIYSSVRANSMSVSNTTKKSKDVAIARRLITVAMTDFLCWFPICVSGLLTSNGFPVSGELNVTMAIFVLPLNSAVNPYLYTVNCILDIRNRARLEKLRNILVTQLNKDILCQGQNN